METKTTEEILRPDEAAKYLNMTRTYLYSLLGADVIPPKYERGKRLIKRADLDAFIESRKTTTL